MITPRDVQPLVASPEFQRLLRLLDPGDTTSRAYRALKGLERLARGTTREHDRDERRGYGKRHEAPGGTAPRRSLKEMTGDGVSERISV